MKIVTSTGRQPARGRSKRFSWVGLKRALTRADGPRVSYSLARIEDPDGNALDLVEYHRIARQ
jgi:hypothetical protein